MVQHSEGWGERVVRLGPTWALYIETLGNSISWQGTCQLLQFTLGNCVEVTVTKEGILGPSQHPSSISDLYLWFLLYDHGDMRSPPIGTMLYREMVSIKKKKKKTEQSIKENWAPDVWNWRKKASSWWTETSWYPDDPPHEKGFPELLLTTGGQSTHV